MKDKYLIGVLIKCMKDIIFKNDDYIITKKGADDIGVYMPTVCLELIDIAIEELSTWKNGGFMHIEAYKQIIDEICSRLQRMVIK